MTDMQGAMGVVQLAKLAELIQTRQERADYYHRELADLKWLILPNVPEGYGHSYQSFVCLVNEKLSPLPRNDLMAALEDSGISTRPGTHAVHTLNYYRDQYDFKPEDLPGALMCHEHSMAIPLHNKMSDSDYEYVVKTLKDF
jgi:dTDP-4-amino-4,6-dideoxygalactose transaminase